MKELKTKEETKDILKRLEQIYPDPETELQYSNPFELLVAVILSAQTTDKQVNKVTKDLFKDLKSPKDFARLEPQELEDYIRGVGLYRNKSKYLVKTSQKIIKDYDGKVPQSRSELMKLSGVGRKTANVVLSCAFDKDAIGVDTHVFRVANRIGLAGSDNVEETEKELMQVIPQNLWSLAHHWLIFHGRNICKSRTPKCDECIINEYCNYYN
ncbi:endonuclease III [Halobacteroides halobius DSM 5150]|uniref:Endonuclease III n=1 Tax=Halobacteroides halobius (strain ATCC 35273 / DSM 5150 / MD-1) TaxID=748449 RepID=L0K9T9_HALHC|nr:endonuclease III [Halobacteroides halobius]AGB40863.1 endonuclease III [Halobacteroides halobius DSM 5150]